MPRLENWYIIFVEILGFGPFSPPLYVAKIELYTT
jgi:hypothetical protein